MAREIGEEARMTEEEWTIWSRLFIKPDGGLRDNWSDVGDRRRWSAPQFAKLYPGLDPFGGLPDPPAYKYIEASAIPTDPEEPQCARVELVYLGGDNRPLTTIQVEAETRKSFGVVDSKGNFIVWGYENGRLPLQTLDGWRPVDRVDYFYEDGVAYKNGLTGEVTEGAVRQVGYEWQVGRRGKRGKPTGCMVWILKDGVLEESVYELRADGGNRFWSEVQWTIFFGDQMKIYTVNKGGRVLPYIRSRKDWEVSKRG